MDFYRIIFSELVSNTGVFSTSQNICLDNRIRKPRFKWLIKAPTFTTTEQLLPKQELNHTGVFFHLRSITSFFASGMVYIRDFNLLILLELFSFLGKSDFYYLVLCRKCEKFFLS